MAEKDPDPAASAGESSWGAWEWVALPEFGISCMKARLDPAARVSHLAAEELEELPDGARRLVRFRIHPLAEDPRVFLLAEAPRCPERPAPQEGTKIRTLLVLGALRREVELILVPRRAGAPPLILGRDAFGGPFTVNPAAAALAGLPRESPEPP